jgi:hypothetical protein
VGLRRYCVRLPGVASNSQGTLLELPTADVTANTRSNSFLRVNTFAVTWQQTGIFTSQGCQYSDANGTHQISDSPYIQTNALTVHARQNITALLCIVLLYDGIDTYTHQDC